MSKFPNNYDDDLTLPPVHDNITEIMGDSINALREAVINIEKNLGLGVHGTASSLSERLGLSLEPDGSIKTSAIASMGLVTLPIFDSHISETAFIKESKLKLDYRTQDLFNYIKDLSGDINKTMGWISVTGSKVDPHVFGITYRHVLDHIDVDEDISRYFTNKYDQYRNNDDAWKLINDINTELVEHHQADSLPYGSGTVTTRNGSQFPSNYAHTSSAIYLQTERFSFIPQTANDVQLFAEYIDNASIFLYGTRIQNLYTNGISRVSRSSSLLTDGYGAPVVPETPVTAFLRMNGTLSIPWDDIGNGDDIVQFFPSSENLDNNLFDTQFSQVRPGDVLRINYGGIQTQYIIKEKKYNSTTDVFMVRIAGKNLSYTTNATARIDRSLVNYNKFGVLAVSAVNNSFGEMPSLLVGSPRGAQTLGNGFNAAVFDSEHYNLYLALFETGDPLDGYTILPSIDVTGNKGKTPGKYTLESIVDSTNAAFRAAGYNYRFMAFSYNGEFGIMLADSVGNAGFSIINAAVDDAGVPNELETSISFPNNVIGVFSNAYDVPPDPLGLGVNGSGASSPPFVGTYGSPESANSYTKLFLPLNRNNYYVNGVERDKLPLQVGQAQDDNGDGYWEATATLEPVGSTVEIKYTIDADLSQTGLAPGKTIVIKDTTGAALVNSGRYILKTCKFNCPPNENTELVVYDAVHAKGFTPTTTIDGYFEYKVSVYFDNNAPSFNSRSAFDFTDNDSIFKRHFEIYSDDAGMLFTHERARFVASTSVENTINSSVTLSTDAEALKLDIMKVSQKLQGFPESALNVIRLHIISYDATTGTFEGYLSKQDNTKEGPVTVGKIGQVIRLYDISYTDYIDIKIDLNAGMSNISNKNLDIQLFNSLEPDHEVMFLATCQLSDSNKKITRIVDQRQFGNTSEKDLSTSALDYISAGDRLLHQNGVLRGFDLGESEYEIPNPYKEQIIMTGGVALVNGKIVQMNDELVAIPIVQELYGVTTYNMQWLLCANDKGEYKLIALRDYFDSLITVNADRTIQVRNPANLEDYYVESDYFANIVQNRKDVVPLYIVQSQVFDDSGPISIILSLDDVRRYANDSDSSLPLTFTNGAHNGNYRTATSILKWLQFNNKNIGEASLRGVDESITTKVTLKTDSEIVIDGHKDCTLAIENELELGSNVILKNMVIDLQSGGIVSFINGTSNITFDNCSFLKSSGASYLTFNQCNNIKFINCSFSIEAATSLLPFYNGMFNFFTCSNIIFDKCNFNMEWSNHPTNVFVIKECIDVSITNCSIVGEYQAAILLYKSSNINVSANTFDNNFALENEYSFGAYPSYGLSSFTYNEFDYVNPGRGYIYCNVDAGISNITIDNNNFINSNSATYLDAFYFTPGSQRYSFIQFELTINTAVVDGITITNNNFTDFISSDVKENCRAAIAVINTAPTVSDTQVFPRVIDLLIENNNCEQNQIIVVSSKKIDTVIGEGPNYSVTMGLPGLVVENGHISRNTCGAIGYWISRGVRTKAEQQYYAPGRGHRVSNLNISRNTCLWIVNLDAHGKAYDPNHEVDDTYSEYGSGAVVISENSTSKISVGVSHIEDSSLKIINNDLVGSSARFFLAFLWAQEPFPSSFGPYNNSAAIRVLGNGPSSHAISSEPSEGNTNMCIISGNTVSTGYTVNAESVELKNAWRYECLIYVNIPANITNNILRGINSNDSIGIYIRCNHAIVTGNEIYRDDQNISAYIYIHKSETDSRGIITNNFFDDHTVDGTDEAVIKWGTASSDYPNFWTIHTNKNQTGYVQIPLTDGHHFNHTYTAVGGSQTVEGGFQYWDWIDEEWYVKPAKSRESPTSPGNTIPVLTEGTSYNSNVLRIKDEYRNGSGSFVPRRFSWKGTLNNYVPYGVDVITATVGLRKFQGTFKTPTNGAYDSRFVISFHEQYQFAVFGGAGDTDFRDAWDLSRFSNADDYDDYMGYENTSGLVIATGDNLNTSGGSTYQASGTFLTSAYGSSVAKNHISVCFEAVWWCNSVDTYLDMLISPIIIKYRW